MGTRGESRSLGKSFLRSPVISLLTLKADLDALSGMTSDLSPSPPLRHITRGAPMNVLVKEIYDMVPLESGEEDITSGDENFSGDVQNNGKVLNVESRSGSRSRRGNKVVDHAAADDDDDS